uniref:Centromere protein T n=1 Tax=Laticauda laticaudata TaxID=8630 RepID=A0A8C5T2P3_LATLA
MRDKGAFSRESLSGGVCLNPDAAENFAEHSKDRRCCLVTVSVGDGGTMANRRSLRRQQPEEEPQRRRRSLRLAREKAAPFSYQRSLAYQAPANSAQLDVVTPRTVFKKVLQTQPVVSPLVSEKPDSPKPVDTIFHFPVKLGSSSSLEVSLSDSIQNQKHRIARHTTRSKKVRVSEFERNLNNQLHSSTSQGLLDHTSLSKSLQISFTTPAPLNSAGKKGLIRRPKSYRAVNVKDFEGGLEQDLLQIKDAAENNPEDQKTTTLQSNNTEALSTETELFLPPLSREEEETEPSNVLPEPDLARQSSGRRSVPSLNQTRLARQEKISGVEVEKVAESSPPQILMPGTESTIEAETESMEKEESFQEKCQESSQDGGKESRPSLGKEKLSPGPEDAGSIKSISQKRIVTPQRQQRMHFHGSSPDEELFTPTESLKTGLGTRRSSTPIDAELPRASQRYFSTWLSRKIVRRSVNEMVALITKELDNIIPELARQDMAKIDPGEGSSLREITVDISQNPRVSTPNRHANGKTPKTPERIPFKAVIDRTNPQTGDRNRTKEMRTVETEQILEFEAEDNPEVKMSESEDVAAEISQSPRVATPRRRASGKTPKTPERTPLKAVRDRTNPQTGDKNKIKEMRTVETEHILEFEAEDSTEVEEMSESEDVAAEISQSPRVATPSRRASGKTPKTLERTPLKAMRDRTNPQTGDRNRTNEMNVETEQILEFEAEDNTEVEEMSESEDVEPTGSTPAFVRAKAFHCTPLLSSPRLLKEVASGSLVKQNLVQRVPKPAKKARREKQGPSLPSTLVKKMFTHYVKMPVTKEALQVVDRCVNVYFKHLSNDLEAYVNHARRKTAEPADLELLMRRQGLITDKTPLNVLVERHLPLEYRKLLIPVAVSGNKVIPQKLK